MSDPALGLTMLALIVVVIMMGFPTAFTLMGLGMFFGFIAFHDPNQAWVQNKIFDLMVQRTYGVMTNDTLLSVPLFVFMGYIIERAALVDKMFYSIQLAFRRVPASLAVTTLIVCTFWGIASGIVGAVVVLMGVIAMKPMLNAGYDVKLASGAITAGGTLGILIPPSVMIIVYAAVAGQSVVKLYAAAMFPGFFLSFLYLIYIIGWAMINPKIAPKLDEKEYSVTAPAWLTSLQNLYTRNVFLSLIMAVVNPAKLLRSDAAKQDSIGYYGILKNFGASLSPLLLLIVMFASVWWYVVIHQTPEAASGKPVATRLVPAESAAVPPRQEPSEPQEMGINTKPAPAAGAEKPGEPTEPQELAGPDMKVLGAAPADAGAAQAGSPAAEAGPPPEFFVYFWASAGIALLLLAFYYRQMNPEQFEILKMLIESVMPLGILTILVLAVILFGITTATESAAVGAAGAVLLALQGKQLSLDRIKQSVFLTAKTTAMVCWLFVGSALFSAVFAILGGQQVIEHWVLSLNMTSVQFMLLSQAIIFFLGWPLEWTEIIVIFVPIFLPLLKHFNVDPILFGTLIAVNLQAAFLSPPVAMSAFYLKGVSPPHVTLNQIFAGMMPYMVIILLCMVIMYFWPGMTLWLPNYLYGGGG